MSEASIYYTTVPSPVGTLRLTATERGLSRLHIGDRVPDPEPGWTPASAPFTEVTAQLEQYFRGERREFRLPLDLQGTAFELSVWNALSEIPYGTTISYGELARRLGKPGASRAVGAANGRNPVAIIVPCHRVVGSNGSLTGYGGGLPVKRALLDHESVVAGAAPSLFPL